MLAVYEDLRDRGASTGALDHLATARRLGKDVDIGVGNALALQECAGAGAIRTEHRGVKFDFSHHLDTLNPSAAIMSRSAVPAPASARRPMRPWPAEGRARILRRLPPS